MHLAARFSLCLGLKPLQSNDGLILQCEQHQPNKAIVDIDEEEEVASSSRSGQSDGTVEVSVFQFKRLLHPELGLLQEWCLLLLASEASSHSSPVCLLLGMPRIFCNASK
jgi:hypothetical protein